MADIIWLHPIQMHHIRQWNEKQIKYIHLLFTTGYLRTIHLAMARQIAYVGSAHYRSANPNLYPQTHHSWYEYTHTQFCAMSWETGVNWRAPFIHRGSCCCRVCIRPPPCTRSSAHTLVCVPPTFVRTAVPPCSRAHALDCVLAKPARTSMTCTVHCAR